MTNILYINVRSVFDTYFRCLTLRHDSRHCAHEFHKTSVRIKLESLPNLINMKEVRKRRCVYLANGLQKQVG